MSSRRTAANHRGRFAATALPPKKFSIEWNKKAKFPGKKDPEDYLESIEVDQPSDAQAIRTDPKLCFTTENFRDGSRRQNQCRNL